MSFVFCAVINLENIEHCEQKTASLLYLYIGTEGRRIFKSKLPPFIDEKELLKELWRVMEDSFTKTENITFDRFVFFSSIQQKRESVKKTSMGDS